MFTAGGMKRNAPPVLRIVSLALVLRLAWASIVPVVPVSDSHAYQVFASVLLDSGTYGWKAGEPTAWWPIGTSLTYAGFYLFFGNSASTVVLVNLLFGALIVYLTMRLAEVWFDRQVAIASGLIVALWPTLIFFTTVIASELIFSALLLCALVLHAEISHRSDTLPLHLFVPLGIVIGLASLVRPVAMLMPLVLAVPLFVASRSLAKVIIFVMVTGLVTLLVLAPWGYRNERAFGSFILGSSSAGANLWMGNLADSGGTYMEPATPVPGDNEVQHSERHGKAAMRHIVEHPIAFVGRTMLKAVRLYALETIGVHWNAEALARLAPRSPGPLKMLSQAYWMAVLAAFMAAVFICFRKQGVLFALHPALMTLAYFTAVYAVIVISDRYHVPTNPVMAIIAALPIVQWTGRWFETRRKFAGRG
jgi:4-amino-4-deoxy-L-arabinose transferase-like glycosyltransferase